MYRNASDVLGYSDKGKQECGTNSGNQAWRELIPPQLYGNASKVSLAIKDHISSAVQTKANTSMEPTHATKQEGNAYHHKCTEIPVKSASQSEITYP